MEMNFGQALAQTIATLLSLGLIFGVFWYVNRVRKQSIALIKTNPDMAVLGAVWRVIQTDLWPLLAVPGVLLVILALTLPWTEGVIRNYGTKSRSGSTIVQIVENPLEKIPILGWLFRNVPRVSLLGGTAQEGVPDGGSVYIPPESGGSVYVPPEISPPESEQRQVVQPTRDPVLWWTRHRAEIPLYPQEKGLVSRMSFPEGMLITVLMTKQAARWENESWSVTLSYGNWSVGPMNANGYFGHGVADSNKFNTPIQVYGVGPWPEDSLVWPPTPTQEPSTTPPPPTESPTPPPTTQPPMWSPPPPTSTPPPPTSDGGCPSRFAPTGVWPEGQLHSNGTMVCCGGKWITGRSCP